MQKTTKQSDIVDLRKLFWEDFKKSEFVRECRKQRDELMIKTLSGNKTV